MTLFRGSLDMTYFTLHFKANQTNGVNYKRLIYKLVQNFTNSLSKELKKSVKCIMKVTQGFAIEKINRRDRVRIK